MLNNKITKGKGESCHYDIQKIVYNEKNDLFNRINWRITFSERKSIIKKYEETQETRENRS